MNTNLLRYVGESVASELLKVPVASGGIPYALQAIRGIGKELDVLRQVYHGRR